MLYWGKGRQRRGRRSFLYLAGVDGVALAICDIADTNWERSGTGCKHLRIRRAAGKTGVQRVGKRIELQPINRFTYGNRANAGHRA